MYSLYNIFNYIKSKLANIIRNKVYITSFISLIIFLFFINILPKKSTKPQSYSNCLDSIDFELCCIDSLKSYIEYFKKENNSVCLAKLYKELGKAYQSNNNLAEAIEAHLKGLTISKQLDDTLTLVSTLNHLGQNYLQIGEYDQASYYFFEAYTYAKKFSKKNEKTMLKKRIMSLNGIGTVFVRQENWLLADSAYNLALKCENKIGNSLGKATSYANLGYVLESAGKIDSAWEYYKVSMAYNVEAKSQLGMALCRMHFGRLYEKNNQWNLALKEYLGAYDLLSESNERWYKLESCIAIANVYLALKDKDSMSRYLEMAKSTAEQIGSFQHLSDVYRIYYKWYESKGDSKRALDNYILNQSYADSVMNKMKSTQMFNTSLKFMQGDHNSEMESMTSNYTNERHLRKMLSTLFIVSLVVVTIIILILLYLLYNKRNMTIEMRNMERTRSNFFTNITHEFRTPLAIILGLGEQIEQKTLDSKEELQKIGSMITFQGNQLLNMVNQLLDISKIQSSLGNPTWCRGNIITFIDMLVENFQRIAEKKHLELVFISKEKAVEMEFVSDYMSKIVMNLLSNAFKFTPEYGKIYLTASIQKEHFVIYVADSGQGISNEDKPYIFDPFYQGNNKSLSEGTGIGLSLVYQLVTAMSGTIEVKSSENEGTVFILRFPLKRKFSNQEEMEVYTPTVYKCKQNVTVKANELPSGKTVDEAIPLILIVEDNSDVAYYIGSQLQNQYTLKYARNGKLAFEMAEDLLPDLIISDIIMPEMDGYELCHSIRSSQLLNHIPIILLSVLNSEEERIKGLKAGADVYLCKPFNSNELNERIEYLLEQRLILRQKYANVQQETESEKLPEADQLFLNKLTDITYAAMSSGNVTVEEIASKMFMSRQQINRKIHSITGENTVTYLMRIRLNRAKMLLDSPQEYLIGDIAMKCGFDDVAYFSRIFKKTYNITPSQYRKRIKD